MIRKDFTWNQCVFNSLQSTFNWFSFATSKNSIDKKGYQLKSICCQFILSYFQRIFLLNIKKTIRTDFNWNQFTINSFESTFTWFSFSVQKNVPKVFVHNRVPSKHIIEDLGHSWSTPFKNCLGAVFFFKGLIRHLTIWETLPFQGFNVDMAF